MNPLEYLILGFLAVIVIGSWVLLDAMHRAEDGFENELGFHLGTAPAVLSLYPRSAYAPVIPARATVPEMSPQSFPRRPPGSKPPMLPADLTVADLNPSTERKPRPPRAQTEMDRQGQDTQPPFSGSANTPNI
jgi:hypothetical protein